MKNQFQPLSCVFFFFSVTSLWGASKPSLPPKPMQWDFPAFIWTKYFHVFPWKKDSICDVSWQSCKNPGEMDQQIWALELGLCSLCVDLHVIPSARKKINKGSCSIRLEGGIKAILELNLVRYIKGSKFSAGISAVKGRVRKMWGCCSAGWEFWWQRTWKLPKYSSFKSLLVKSAFRNPSFLDQSKEDSASGKENPVRGC